ncbi:MAG: aminoacyl-tRNA hydrolase [Cytophagales bacterium]|nr:MAG: aminoacyl-tRNA hydrolase [Cytophagales bacterium]
MKYLIVGLGNIGKEYELTRHNIGFLVLDQLADVHEVDFRTEHLAQKTEVKYKGRTLHLIKPSTYMNLSGKAVNYWMQKLDIAPENVLVIVDDISLPHGKLRLRAKGSAAGHNGLSHIEATLGHNEYPRLKFGIGSDFPKGALADYVLSNFSEEQLADLINPINKAKEIIYAFTTIGIEKAMSQANQS